MDKEEIKRICIQQIERHQNGIKTENPKFDFKSKWHDLNDINGISELCKDITAIANTPGLDGFIVFGYDEKTQKVNNAKISDSGMADENDIMRLIEKNVDGYLIFNIYETNYNGDIISLIHIPPCYNKPLVIRNCRKRDAKGNINDNFHRIFIRKNTSTEVATKYDMDYMSYDNKKHLPDYSLSAYVSRITIVHGLPAKKLVMSLMIHNKGFFPLCFYDVQVYIGSDQNHLKPIGIVYNNELPGTKGIKEKPLLIRQGQVELFPELYSSESIMYSEHEIQMYNDYLRDTKKIKYRFTHLNGMVFEGDADRIT